MSSAKLKLLAASAASAAAVWGCANMGGGIAAKSSSGIPLGSSGPHAVQPLPDKPRFGQPVSEADLVAWNIDIRTPDGLGLPVGQGSVAEGKKIYEANCIACHGADAKGGSVYGAMYIRRSMPMDRPQALAANEVYALSAYLLNLNGLVPANAVMDQTSLPRVQMPNRDGFLIDDRPDTKAVRCMTNCK